MPAPASRRSARRWALDAPAEIDILLSHLHLDHVSGLPFFKPVLLGKHLVRTYCGNLDGESAREVLDRLYSPPLFPVGLDHLPGRFEHIGFRGGEPLRLTDGLLVKTHPLHHPGGATGFRFDHRGRSVCYISDIEHTAPWPPDSLVRFVEGTDLLIYDGMFSEAEYCTCVGWGHSTWQKGVVLAKAAGAKALAIFHLHPAHEDDHLLQVEQAAKAEMPERFRRARRPGARVRPGRLSRCRETREPAQIDTSAAMVLPKRGASVSAASCSKVPAIATECRTPCPLQPSRSPSSSRPPLC